MFGQYSANSPYNSTRTMERESGVKKVFDNSMVVHVWAANKQSEGRSNNGNLYFNGPTLYSYGSHFAVGHILPTGEVLLNSDTYSISTSRHQSEASQATSHMLRLRVPALTDLVRYSLSPKHIVEHVTAHALVIGVQAGTFLLGLAKVKNPAAAFNRIKAKAERDAAAKVAKEEAGKQKRLLADATYLAKLTPAELATRLKAGRSEWDAIRTTEREALRVYQAHKAAIKAGRTAQKVKLSAILKATRAELAFRRETVAIIERNRYIKGLIPKFRVYAERHLAGRLSGYDYQQFAGAARFLLAHAKGITPATGAKLAAVELEASALHREVMAREIEENRIRQLAETAARAIRETEKREAWLAGTGHWHGVDAEGRTLLRAVEVERDESGTIVGGMLQTSQGADVPLRHAIRAFQFVKMCRANGQPWNRNGRTLRVGHFQVDSIDTEGNFQAGCHSLTWAECQRIAAALGLDSLVPSDQALESSH